VGPIYVTGHRNPDTDTVAAAIGYAELGRRLHPAEEYLPVRLGDCNAQTRWVIERSGAPEPEFLPHVMPRACDVMKTTFPITTDDEPIREAGLAKAHADLEVVPVVDDTGALTGVLTERALARRYVRETRHTSTLEEAPTRVTAVVSALGGELLTGEDRRLSGRVWVHSMDVESRSGISPGDVVVVGDRSEAQLRAIELGAALVVISNSASPTEEVLELARAHGTAVIRSALDSYVSGRMITLAAPCGALMEKDPITVAPDYLLVDVSEQIRESHYGAAVAVDAEGRPVGLITRSDIVSPPRRRVVLVDHAEQGQSVAGIDQAEIVEILDHHHRRMEARAEPVGPGPVQSVQYLLLDRGSDRLWVEATPMERVPVIATEPVNTRIEEIVSASGTLESITKVNGTDYDLTIDTRRGPVTLRQGRGAYLPEVTTMVSGTTQGWVRPVVAATRSLIAARLSIGDVLVNASGERATVVATRPSGGQTEVMVTTRSGEKGVIKAEKDRPFIVEKPKPEAETAAEVIPVIGPAPEAGPFL